ncbi:MAG: tRNA (guanosine(37)-N1)-methyltransferase TrmD [Hahellaceae bacterium]|nr:tRNA (guanosine(37)-N1)-methyltransferase TrmD [Hahellaceae bacterium]
MWIGAVSLFPEMFSSVVDYGVTGRAVRNGIVQFECWNPRDFTEDKHRTVDDRPYGGGPGMLMKVEPLEKAIRAAKQSAGDGVRVLYMSPQGRRFDQEGARYLAGFDKLLLVAGRYEGVDERLIEAEIDEEWSLGDFVLSGGEIAAIAVIDAVARLLPGVLGHDLSAAQDSFFEGLLDCPHYTRPEIYAGVPVPEVLLSGHHEQIRRWRQKQALGRTWQRRPDLLEHRSLDQVERELLAEFIRECEASGNIV